MKKILLLTALSLIVGLIFGEMITGPTELEQNNYLILNHNILLKEAVADSIKKVVSNASLQFTFGEYLHLWVLTPEGFGANATIRVWPKVFVINWANGYQPNIMAILKKLGGSNFTLKETNDPLLLSGLEYWGENSKK